MLKTCAKTVYYLCGFGSKVGGVSSTADAKNSRNKIDHVGKTQVFRTYPKGFSQPNSQPKTVISPLFEYSFYSVSTPPITKTTNLKRI